MNMIKINEKYDKILKFILYTYIRDYATDLVIVDITPSHKFAST